MPSNNGNGKVRTSVYFFKEIYDALLKYDKHFSIIVNKALCDYLKLDMDIDRLAEEEKIRSRMYCAKTERNKKFKHALLRLPPKSVVRINEVHRRFKDEGFSYSYIYFAINSYVKRGFFKRISRGVYERV